MWSIQEKTGWTDHYILWEVSLVNLRMKMADAVRYSSKEKVKEMDNLDEFEFKT